MIRALVLSCGLSACSGCCFLGAPPEPAPVTLAQSAIDPSPRAQIVEAAEPAIATSTPTTAPPEWPTDFPTVPGGVARAAPSMGPVRVALIAYPSRDLVATEHAYRDALARDGWTVEDAPSADDEAQRFVADHGGESVSVSIYRDGADTIVQTMQLGGTTESTR